MNTQQNIEKIQRLRTKKVKGELADRLLAPANGAVVAKNSTADIVDQLFKLLFEHEPSLCVIEVRLKYPHNDDIISAKRQGKPLTSNVRAETLTPEILNRIAGKT